MIVTVYHWRPGAFVSAHVSDFDAVYAELYRALGQPVIAITYEREGL
jgi:hypothetical protein